MLEPGNPSRDPLPGPCQSRQTRRLIVGGLPCAFDPRGGPVLIRNVAKGLGILFVGLFVIIAVGVGASGVARVQARQLAEPTGPSAVGRIELALTDAARIDPFASDGRPREIAVWIWYPTAKGNSAATAPYLPKPWADAANHVYGPASVLFRIDARAESTGPGRVGFQSRRVRGSLARRQCVVRGLRA